MKSFILTLQFLTRIPIHKEIEATEKDFARGIVYFPIVGLIIGLFNVGVYYGTLQIFDGMIPVVCYLLANTLITGGLHIDGLSDTMDAFFSSRKKERMLEIMKDSRIGAFGTISIIFDFMFRFALIYSMKDYELIFLILLLSPVIGKTLMVFLMYISNYARNNGMGGLYIGKISLQQLITVLVLGIGMTALALGYKGLIIFLISLIIAIIYRLYVYGKIQGMTGDTVGAANEIIEIGLLFVSLVFIQNGIF